MSVRIFLSTVSDEFRDYRDVLRHDFTRHNVEVKVQEDFKDLGTVTLDKLDVYIANCDAVVHLVGDMTGADARPESTRSMLAKYPDLPDRLPPLRQPLADGVAISYTQWEAWLAVYHGKLLVIAKADDAAPRGPNYTPTDDSRAAQQEHLARLSAVERYPGVTFTGPDNLAKLVLSGVILDLLATAANRRAKNRRTKIRTAGRTMAAKIFISYRRNDSAGHAGRVMDRLEREFGLDQLFMDVDAIPLGANFVKVLREEVAKCDVLLAVIGPNWLETRDDDGNRRLDNPNDFVRIEVAAALQRDIPVIPILLDGAGIPKANQLPKNLKELASRNGLSVRHDSFHGDMDRLIRGLKLIR